MNTFRFDRWIGVKGVPVQCFKACGSYSGKSVALLSKDQADGHTRWFAVFGTSLNCWRSIEVFLEATVVLYRVTKLVSVEHTPVQSPDTTLLHRRLSVIPQPLPRHVRVFELSYVYTPESPMILTTARRISRPELSYAHMQAALLSRLYKTHWGSTEFKHLTLRLRQLQENSRVVERFRSVDNCEVQCVSDDPLSPLSAGNSQRRHSFLIQSAENSNFNTTPDRTD